MLATRSRLEAKATGLGLLAEDESEDEHEQQPVREEDNLESAQHDKNGSLISRSPFTRLFSTTTNLVPLSDTQQTINTTFSPEGFTILQDIIHLFPLWSCILQRNRELLTQGAGSLSHDDEKRCLTNGLVKSHFKSIKHGRLGHRSRVRPREFMEHEMAYIAGKLNEQLLPVQKQKGRRKK